MNYQKEQGYKGTIAELTKQRDSLDSRLSEAIEALEEIKSGELGGLEMCRDAMMVYAKDTLAKLKEG